jgi:radical SAM-linked protein
LTRTRDRVGRESATEVRRRFEAILEQVQNSSRLVGSEPGSGPGFSHAETELRVTLAFPDAYEVGISNQAIQILYHLAREVRGVGVERAYLPWVDVLGRMREADVPLLSVETWTRVCETHVLGISLQHELNFSNVLELLDVSRIPLRSCDRGEDDPLVLAGGPATANFLPMAPFFDAVVVGDGEEVFPEVLGALREGMLGGESRNARLSRLARLKGVCVPGPGAVVERRVLTSLAGAPYPTESLVPLAAGIHDRAWVEVMRGCSRGCRFCQAGMWYRPVRERTRDEILSMAAGQLCATGHDELALSSLSTTDYSGLESLLAELALRHPEVRVALPSLRVDSAAVRLGHLVSPSGTSLTLAPEAGSQRMRDVINKNVTEEDVLSAAREAFAAGRTTLKLYFMIGLPTETDEDVRAIVELCGRLCHLGRQMLGRQTSRLRLNISVTNFIPKPFTPFQWEAMADRETLRRRQELLRSGLSRLPARLALHGVDNSYLEAALARGGEEMADVIEAAWRAGARFDSWTEQERPLAWAGAFGAAGLSAEGLATTALEADAPLPWDVITGAVTREYLWAEHQRALTGSTTADCRWSVCSECGACSGPVRIELAHSDDAGAGTGTCPALSAPSAAEETGAAAAGVLPPRPILQYLAKFSVTGRARFVAHLDSLQLLRRAIRGAGGRLALSQGMRPKPLLSLALPRGVGVESHGELLQFALAESPPADFVPRLEHGLPPGFHLEHLERYEERRPVAARVTGTRYRLHVAEDVEMPEARALRDSQGGVVQGDLGEALTLAASRYTGLDKLLVERVRAGVSRTLDVHAYVAVIEIGPADAEVAPGEGCGLQDPGVMVEYECRVTPFGTARPADVVEALARLSGRTLRLVRAERLEISLT